MIKPMPIINIEKRICIPHSNLCGDIFTYIFNHIKLVYENECSKEYGHILKVVGPLKIKKHYISNVNCDNIFLVDFGAYVLKPEINNEYDAVVSLIIKEGIFVIIDNKQQMAISPSYLKDFVFEPKQKCMIDTINNRHINVGDKIRVVVLGSRYNNQTFSCYGKIL